MVRVELVLVKVLNLNPIYLQHNMNFSAKISFHKYLGFLLFLLVQTNIQGQCLKTLPYMHYFPYGTNQLTCWDNTLGTLVPTNQTQSIYKFNDAGQTGISILESPEIVVNTNSRINYFLYSSGSSGANDSLKVLIKNTSDTAWNVLKQYPSNALVTNEYEDLGIDTSLINDTVQIRFVFYAGTNSNQLKIDNFRITSDLSDTLYTLPFHESFDGSMWRPDSAIGTGAFSQLYKLDPSWRATPWEHNSITYLRWVTANDSTNSPGTGPLSDYSGSGNYVYTEASWNGEKAELYTPYLLFDSIPYPQLSFWYHMRGEAMGTLFIDQLVGNNWLVQDSIVGPQHININDPWLQHTTLLDSTGSSQIRFRLDFNNLPFWKFTQDAAIDEVEIDAAVCPFPNGFTVDFTNNTISSVLASWPSGPNSNSYILEYDTVGFTPGNGLIDTVYSTSTLINNLNPSSYYDVYVKLLCNVADTSLWKGPFAFQTECAYNAPYLETFDDTIIHYCWTAHNQLKDQPRNASWLGTGRVAFPWYGAQNAIDHTGNNGRAIGVDGSNPMPLDSIAILSPFIDVSNLKVPEVRMWIFSNNTNYPDENNTFYMDFYDGAQWNYNVLSHAKDSTDWVELSLELNQFNIVGDVRFRLVVDKDTLNAGWYNDIIIDDFSVDEGYGNSCDIPDSLHAIYVDCDSIEIVWNSYQTNGLTRIKYGPTGFDFNTAGTWISASSPITINNLQVGQTYDFYVVDSCTEGLGISNPLTLTTDSTKLPTLNYSHTVYAYTDSSVTYLFDARSTVGGNTFEWDFGSGNIAYGDTALWTFYQNYNHWITLIVSNACGQKSQLITLPINNIGIAELKQAQDLIIYPNPSDGNIELEFSGYSEQEIAIEVWDERGILVFKKQVTINTNNSRIILDLRFLKPGVYVVQIHSTEGTQQKRVILQN